MKLREIIKDIVAYLRKIEPEGKLEYTITSNSTGEMMDAFYDYKSKLIEPFTDSPEQNYYYYNINVKDNVILKVKSNEKKLKNA